MKMSILIVSLTSYPERIESVKIVLDCLYKQSLQADRIILWLAEDEFPNKEKDLPTSMQQDLDVGRFILRWCDNIGSHKKYFYAMQEYPEDIIVTVDDDAYYHPNVLEKLMETYAIYPDAVAALTTYMPRFDSKMNPLPIHQWLFDFNEIHAPSMLLMASGVGGVLYPPHSIDKRIFDKQFILENCSAEGRIFGDDILLKAGEMLKGTPVISVDDNTYYRLPAAYNFRLADLMPFELHKDALIARLQSHFNNQFDKESQERLRDAIAAFDSLAFTDDLMKKYSLSWLSRELDRNFGYRCLTLPSFSLSEQDCSMINRLVQLATHVFGDCSSKGPNDSSAKAIEEFRGKLAVIPGIDCLAKNNISLRRLIEYGAVLSVDNHPQCSGDYYEAFQDDIKSLNIKVSVIVPVYNVEQYISRCIESLQNQTIQELEFIFVDDCSTDDSMSAVEAWADEDDRVIIIRNSENLGAGPSRNRGISISRGDYLSFVDPDDYISFTFYESLYSAAISDEGHDIAKGYLCKTDGSTNSIEPDYTKLNDRIRWNLSEGTPLFLGFIWQHQTAIYKSHLFQDDEIRYGKARKGEDVTFLLSVCLKTNDITFSHEAVYYYVQREDSALFTLTPNRFFSELDSFEEKVVILKKRGMDDYARRYLSIKLHEYLSNYENAAKKISSLEKIRTVYYQRLDSILATTVNSQKTPVGQITEQGFRTDCSAVNESGKVE